MSMVSGVIGGVDTHADVHVAAAVDTNGGVLEIESFPTDTAGSEALVGWLVGFGPVLRVRGGGDRFVWGRPVPVPLRPGCCGR